VALAAGRFEMVDTVLVIAGIVTFAVLFALVGGFERV
jgi:hypothetical protein